jgi:hypothetical protein
MCPRNSDLQDSGQAIIDNPRVVEAEFDRAVSEFCGTALKRISASNAAALCCWVKRLGASLRIAIVFAAPS